MTYIVIYLYIVNNTGENMSFDNFFEEVKEEFNYEEKKKEFINNLDMLKSMSVEEQTLYKKWQEFNKNPDFNKFAYKFDTFSKKIWKPTDIHNYDLTISEIQNLDPYIEIVDNSNQTSVENWTLLRRLIHTMEYVANPGRNIKVIAKDRNTNKVLGMMSLGSDVTSLGVRDNYIGWTKDNKYKDGKLRCTSIGTSIVATQPFGFNFLGGKLVAMLLTDESLRQHWKKTYGDELDGLTTTSIYGIHSMYNGIPLWKTLGESAGKMSLKPDDSVYKPWMEWMKDERADDYKRIMTQKEGVSGPPTGVKMQIIGYIFKELGIRKADYDHGFKRGVYFSSFYENGRDFLRNEINADELVMRPKFAQGSEYINKWWKRKAIKRYTKLHNENRLKPETLYYSDILGMTWEQAKEKYLGEVGR